MALGRMNKGNRSRKQDLMTQILIQRSMYEKPKWTMDQLKASVAGYGKKKADELLEILKKEAQDYGVGK